jgi:hypothetical protein
MKHKLLLFAIAAFATFAISSCSEESDVASYNVSQAAHNFEVVRRVVFYNGITGEYILTIEGLLSVTPEDKRLSVIVKTGHNQYKKHYLGVSDNVTWFCEQLDSANVDPFHYKVIFRPKTIVPDIEVQN